LKYNSKIIHISTDYVFDGYKSKSDYYTEYDLPNPLSYYGISKLNGEHTVLNSSKNNVVIRTSWLYGNNGHNFLKSILRKSTISKSISVVNDQYGTPTWSMDLAFQIAMIINSNFNGLCHATSQGFCTWFDLATLFFNLMNIDCDIIPCNTSDYPTIAARPKNSILENVNLKNMKIDVMPHWKSSLKRFVKLYGNNLLYEVTREQKMNKF
jgi:dTDP-4-dehydrorhamnose reductase